MTIKCPARDAIVNIPAAAAGQLLKCPCGTQLRSPAAAVGPAGGASSTASPKTVAGSPASGSDSSASGDFDSSVFDDLPSSPPHTDPNPFTQTSPYAPPGPNSSENVAGPRLMAPVGASSQTHPVSIVSLIFGILSLTLGCCCWLHIPLGLTAVVTGGFGIHFGNQGNGGKGMAIAGLIMGIISLIVYTILALIGVAAQFANIPNGAFNQ